MEHKQTYITPAEAFAVYAALAQHSPDLQAQDLFVFIDNEAAAAALIRGDSTSHDIAVLAQACQWIALAHDIRIWFEWVDTASNISDGLSRDGLADEWTCAQGWHLAEGNAPPRVDLNSLQTLVDRTLA